MTQPIASTIVRGIEFSILGVEVNKTLKCMDRCPYSKNSSCEHRNKSMRKPIQGKLVCSLIEVNIKNFTDKPEILHGSGYPKIIDYKGFSSDAIYFCDACEEILPKDFVNTYSYNLIPKSQINTIFVFPELDPDTALHRFIYSNGHDIWDIVIGESSFEVCEKEAKEKEAKAKGITVEELKGLLSTSSEIGDYFLDIDRNIKQLKYCIFKRFNNVLDKRQKVYLENEIRNLIYSIDTTVEELPQSIKQKSIIKYQKFIVEYQKIKEDFLKSKEKEQEEEIEENKKRIKIDDIRAKIKAITDLSPEAFEEYVASLFSIMGYKVELTPKSGDKGIDIFLYKDDKKIAVQCKKFSKKNLVGSPDIQRFLGAIHNTNAVKGIFITTSFFTLGAEKFAQNNPIELIDYIKLEKMICEILL